MAVGQVTREELQAALPETTGTLRLTGLEGPVEVYRDRYGIPHATGRVGARCVLRPGLRDGAGPAVADGVRPAPGHGPLGRVRRVERGRAGRGHAALPARRHGAAGLRRTERRDAGHAGRLRRRGQRLRGVVRGAAGGVRPGGRHARAVGALALAGCLQGAPHYHGQLRRKAVAGPAPAGAWAGEGGAHAARLPARPPGHRPARRRVRGPRRGRAG